MEIGGMATNHRGKVQEEAKHKTRLVFLIRCKRSKLQPYFIVNKVNKLLNEQYQQNPAHTGRINKTKLWLSRRLLNTEIDIAAYKLRHCRRVIRQLDASLYSRLPLVTYANLNQRNHESGVVAYAQHKERLLRKFNRLTGSYETREDSAG